MILADTSVWTRYLVRAKQRDERFASFVAEREIVCHPWVFGELLLAGISPLVAREIENLDFLPVVAHAEVVTFVRQVHPRGVGWVDVHILLSAIQSGAYLWTFDEGLATQAERFGCSILSG